MTSNMKTGYVFLDKTVKTLHIYDQCNLVKGFMMCGDCNQI